VRSNLNWVTATLNGGICQDPQAANFRREAADARNVWCPQGDVRRRPGSEFLGNLLGSYYSAATISDGDTALYVDKITSAGVETDGTFDISSLDVDGAMYIGYPPTIVDNRNLVVALGWTLASYNSNASQYKLEYWNGTDWKLLPSFSGERTYPWYQPRSFPGSSASSIDRPNFAVPNDWTLLTRGSGSAYWVRLTVKGAAIDADCVFDSLFWHESTNTFRGMITGILDRSYIVAGLMQVSGVTHLAGHVNGIGGTALAGVAATASGENFYPEPSTFASVDYDGCVYFTTPAGIYYVSRDNISTTADTAPVLQPAVVDTSLFSTSSGAAFDSTLHQLEGAFPASCQRRPWKTSSRAARSPSPV
jgi:hypothetical protein